MKARRADILAAVSNPDGQYRLLLLHGPDESGSRALAERLGETMGGQAVRVDLGPQELKADPARLADEAAATSMFGDKVLIRLSGIGDESAPAIAALLEAPMAGNPVVAIAGALRKTSALLKLAEASPAALAFASYPPEGRDALSLATELARARGLRPTRAALDALCAAAGGDRALLDNEIEKIALYLDASPDQPMEVDADILPSLVSGLEEGDLGQLVNAVAGGMLAETKAQLSRIEESGIAGIPLLRAVLGRMALLAQIRGEMDRGESVEQALSTKGRAVFWKDRAAVQTEARAWNAEAIAGSLSHLLKAERAIKEPGSAGERLATMALIDVARMGARLKRN